MNDRTKTILLAVLLTVGVVSPFLVGIVARQQMRGSHRRFAGPVGRNTNSFDARAGSADPIFPGWDVEPPDRRFRTATDSAGRIHFDLRDKPSNLTLLVSHPDVIEPELTRGRWLILVFSLLNADDIHQAISSPELSTRLDGICRVAVRPSLHFEETPKWLPEVEDDLRSRHGLWFLLEGGVVIRYSSGFQGHDDLIRFAQMGRATQDRPNVP